MKLKGEVGNVQWSVKPEAGVTIWCLYGAIGDEGGYLPMENQWRGGQMRDSFHSVVEGGPCNCFRLGHPLPFVPLDCIDNFSGSIGTI